MARPQAAPPSAAMVQQPLPQPKFRMQMADEPGVAPRPIRENRPVVVRMPSPEELGVNSSRADSTSWGEAHRRLDRLGATCFHLEKIAEGRCRCTCLLPTNQPNRSHRVEATAATEAEAALLTLDEAEKWAGTR